MSFISDLLNVGGQYYLGESGADAYKEVGDQALAMGEAAGETAVERTQFQPYAVTSSLATAQTTPEGGLRLDLSEAERQRQNQRFRQAEALYGTLGTDPRRMASEYYENIRAAARPEEERARRGLEQSLFTSGRGGISTAEYGGTAEEFGFEKALAEARLGAGAQARELALAERDQQLKAAGLLTDAAYQPQREAIDLFGAGAVPAQLAQQSYLTGAELASQLEQSGIEGFLQGQQLASYLERAALEGALPAITGTLDPETGEYRGGLAGGIGGLFQEDGLLGGLGLGDLFK